MQNRTSARIGCVRQDARSGAALEDGAGISKQSDAGKFAAGPDGMGLVS